VEELRVSGLKLLGVDDLTGAVDHLEGDRHLRHQRPVSASIGRISRWWVSPEAGERYSKPLPRGSNHPSAGSTM